MKKDFGSQEGKAWLGSGCVQQESRTATDRGIVRQWKEFEDSGKPYPNPGHIFGRGV